VVEISTPGTWRLNAQRYRLVGEQCLNLDPQTGKICKTFIFPPRDICPVCKGEVIIDSQNGVIFGN
jgi:uncharacterized OB-fold protein